MADPSRHHDSKPDTGVPRWVKVLGIVVVVIGLLIVVMMLIGGGDHGPGRHGALGAVPFSGVAAIAAPDAGDHR